MSNRAVRLPRTVPSRWIVSRGPVPGQQWARKGTYRRLLLVNRGRHDTLVYRGDELVAVITGPLMAGLRKLHPTGRPRGC